MATLLELRQLVNAYPYKLSEENLDELFSIMEEVHYKEGEVIVEAGSINSNIFISREGVCRGYTTQEGKEATLYFGMEGDIIASMHSFYYNEPSVITIEACCDMIMMRIDVKDMAKLIEESLQFAHWALSMVIGQLYILEKKRDLIAGDAYERYSNLIINRPQLFQRVPLKAIASYLGITQSSLSRLRNPNYRKNTSR